MQGGQIMKKLLVTATAVLMFALPTAGRAGSGVVAQWSGTYTDYDGGIDGAFNPATGAALEACLRVGCQVIAGPATASTGASTSAATGGTATAAILPKISSARGYYKRGDAFRREGSYYLAIRDYTSAIRLNPNYAAAYNARAWILYLLGRNEEALPDAERAVSLAPDNAYNLGTKGHVLAALGQSSEALEMFERGMTVADDDWI